VDEHAPRLDLGTARRAAQRFVGGSCELIACWQRPDNLYIVQSDDADDDCTFYFYFTVIERARMHVGGTRHVAVNRRSGKVTDLGRLGE
jgi:hypothetical protein